MPDQSGRVIVVTGANSGIGFAATIAFAEKNAHVIMACRNRERAHTARDRIRRDVDTGDLVVKELDLATLGSVQSFAAAVTAEYDGVDVLCNNAGVMAIPRRETRDGFEYQFGVNHLGHFALTAHLLPLLANARDTSRVVTVSSSLHKQGTIDFTDLHWEESYDKWRAYAQSKLANVLFAYELDRRLISAGMPVRSVACHPGWAATNLQRRGPEQAGSRVRVWVMWLANKLFGQSPARGVRPVLYAATMPDGTGGEYIGPRWFGWRGPPIPQRSSQRTYDPGLARRLWAVSEELTGVSFELPESSESNPDPN